MTHCRRKVQTKIEKTIYSFVYTFLKAYPQNSNTDQSEEKDECSRSYDMRQTHPPCQQPFYRLKLGTQLGTISSQSSRQCFRSVCALGPVKVGFTECRDVINYWRQYHLTIINFGSIVGTMQKNSVHFLAEVDISVDVKRVEKDRDYQKE